MNEDPQSAYEAQIIGHWDGLHQQPRFRPQYPSEHVVRFLMCNFPPERRPSLRALDIGVGGGRHVKLLCELGFQTFGIDISSEGLHQCERWLRSLNHEATLRQATMDHLPFAEGSFDLAISFGVYYYTDSAGVERAVAELHRVLAPGGLALVFMRTTDDYRFGKGVPVEPHSFRLDIDDTNERGLLVHFLEEADMPRLFSSFSDVQFEKTEFTFNQRRSVNSDWLITVRK